jgi:transcription elongation factor GreB
MTKSAYITPAGFARLRDELDKLLRVERPRVTQEVSVAAAHGDRSENAEYIYGKKRLREIDGRIRFLTKRLDELTVVTLTPERSDRVYFGARVTIEDEEGEQSRYRIVGPDESDASKGRISMDSPLARALLGRAVGEEVSVSRPRGVATVVLTDIDYSPLEGD